MTRLAAVVVLTLMLAAAPGSAQTPAGATPPAPAQPAAPAPQAASAPQPPRPFPEGAKIAFVNIQRVANESSEGKAATARVKALNDKKVQELNEKQKQLQGLQTKLQQGGGVLSDQARGQLEKDIEKVNVDIQRFTQDAQAEVQELQQELQVEFQRKLLPVIAAVSQEKGLHMVFSQVDSGLVWADTGLDVTSDVIKRFDQLTTPPASSAAPKP